jgi:hypothetical protein
VKRLRIVKIVFDQKKKIISIAGGLSPKLDLSKHTTFNPC